MLNSHIRSQIQIHDGRWQFSSWFQEKCLLVSQLLEIPFYEPMRPFQTVLGCRFLWSLRNNFSAYDAFYVAVAAQTGGTLLTLDRKLSNAPKLPCSIAVF